MVPAHQSVFVPPGEPDPCGYLQLQRQPEPDSQLWQGRDPDHGRLWQMHCPGRWVIGADGNRGQLADAIVIYYVPDGTWPHQVAPVDPQMVVERATGQLDVPEPVIHFGPDASELAVRVPIWLWIDDPGVITETATAGPITATVTARITSTQWEMGEPWQVDRPHQPAPAVTCDGAGAAYTIGADRTNPPCGYTYAWRSLPERTAGSGTWPVTVTATYTVTWELNTGETDTETVTATSTTAVQVGEWRPILVHDR